MFNVLMLTRQNFYDVAKKSGRNVDELVQMLEDGEKTNSIVLITYLSDESKFVIEQALLKKYAGTGISEALFQELFAKEKEFVIQAQNDYIRNVMDRYRDASEALE